MAVVPVRIPGEPVGATVPACFIFGEIPGLLQPAGGAVIVADLDVFITPAGGSVRSPCLPDTPKLSL